MKNEMYISTTIDHPGLLESLVEKLAYRRYEIGYAKEKMPRNFEAIEPSSAETYASGTVEIKDNEKNINMPFVTHFLFTCIKDRNGEYKLTWASGMS